jgi:hypothetical protein
MENKESKKKDSHEKERVSAAFFMKKEDRKDP